MQRILPLVVSLFCLSGCAPAQHQTTNPAQTIQQQYADISEFSMDVKFLCDSGESILEYDTSFEYNKEYGHTLTLESPLSGVSIHITGDTPETLTIQYEDTVLDAAPSQIAGTSAADCIPLLLTDVLQSAPTEVWEESQSGTDFYVVRYQAQDASVARQIWFEQSTLFPTYAEIYQDGKRVIQLFFSEFQANKVVS